MNSRIVASVFPFQSHPKSKALFHIEFDANTPDIIMKNTIEDKMYIKYGENYPYTLKISKEGKESDYYGECDVCGGYCLDSHDM